MNSSIPEKESVFTMKHEFQETIQYEKEKQAGRPLKKLGDNPQAKTYSKILDEYRVLMEDSATHENVDKFKFLDELKKHCLKVCI